MPRGYSIYDSARLQGRLWTPAVLKPAMWLDASDLSTITADANGVNTFKDKSLNLSNYTQTTAAKKPQLTIHSRSGLPALSFDGGDSMTSTTGVTSGNYSGDLTFFYFATRSTFGANAGGDLFTERNVAADQGGYIFAWVEYAGIYYIADAVTVGVSTFDLLASNGAVVTQNHRSGLTERLWVNGTSQTVTGAKGNITAAAGSILGSRSGDAAPWEGLIGEIIATTATLSDYTRQIVEAYLAWKWNATLTASNPYVSRPPLIGD